ncbi:MAG: alpha/beta fold hydrolase [Myxococcales bacterium]|nr:alpha/beta fold hydrolase [Myxococcales bacterium]
MTEETLTLTADDGTALAARLFRPAGTPRLAVLVNGAVGAPQRFYTALAAWLAERGALVLTYDYRGIGASRAGSLRGAPIDMLDWAQRDYPAALDALAAAGPGLPLAVVGHSFGGQALGMTPASLRLAAAALVAAQSGYHGHWSGRGRLRMLTLWYALIPGATAVAGFFPRQLGLGADLPGGMARQWARWGRHPDYVLSELGDAATYRQLSMPRLAMRFTDDDFAPARAVEALLGWMPQDDLERVVIDPADVGQPVGHFGFFRPALGERLWPQLWAFLDRVALP